MELLVAADSLFLRTPDGRYWCKTIYGYKFWVRYLTVFDDVVIVSRTKSADFSEVEGYLQVNGPHVTVAELPYMRGMKQYITHYFKFRKAARDAVKNAECALIRLPSVSAFMVLKYFKKLGKPYALEVVADPFDAYASNKIAQFLYTWKLKEAVRKANGVSYVTQKYLQSKYPSSASIYGNSNAFFESYYSTIDLPVTYLTHPRGYTTEKKENFTIVHTANSINNDNKGHETLIKILKKLREKKYKVNVVFIGDGSRRPYFERISEELGVKDHITFTGLLSSSQKVRETLLQGDLFVFPTKAEGLPRAIIEAMAVGLPCLSTPVNGIPELLNKENLYDPLDVDGFTNKIIELLNSPEKLELMSKENVAKAREYTIDKITIRRNEFYESLKRLAIKINN
ncbi:glycosyltransferase [Mesobacillus subterraneus]|uniref:Glycosyltransferase n=1 Tax=Mesobacillus subterraneus TaxID=285983 RepID=A0A427TRD3_9BACI|nr:glycosyltransferase [Mesobacillus subterraneus]RSD26962.1 glycosyltransferase [Mesobacillus subterraneus]